MKFKYLGDKEDMTVFGYDFADGNEPDVTDANAISRLKTNSHFEAISEEDKGTKVSELLPYIDTVATLEELGNLAEGETRSTVLAAIARRQKKLQNPE